jgi:predicted nucleotidyltransferase
MNTPTIDLPATDFEIVKNILMRHVGNYEVRAFGSRVSHTAKKFSDLDSDLDLVIMTKQPLPLTILGDLAEDFSASTLPIKVDIIDWSRISDEFRQIISSNYHRLHLKKEKITLKSYYLHPANLQICLVASVYKPVTNTRLLSTFPLAP